MNLDYALERLYDTGWSPSYRRDEPCEALADGRRFPSVDTIRREFAAAGLTLTFKHNLMFNTFRATWTTTSVDSPRSEQHSSDADADSAQGTVVGSSECEAAVYALAQLRLSQSAASIARA